MILHQTWKSKDVPEDIFPKAWTNSWEALNPTIEKRLWTDEDNDRLIRDHYPEWRDLYYSFDLPIQRADLARYFILHRHGGLYADLDVQCLKPIDICCP